MNHIKRKAINDLASRLVNILELQVPIQVEEVPKMIGGKLELIDGYIDGDMEAMVKKEGSDSFNIIVSKEKHHLRRRFSIAHELGHLFIHMGYLIRPELWEEVGDYRDSVYYRYGYSKEELEANEFAGAFLMPEEEFRKFAKSKLDKGYYDVDAIAEHFDVSVEAARIRGRQLGLFSWE